MKIAIISDIHGNLQALESTLEDVKAKNCDKIFCLGDLAMAGPEPNKTIERIKELLNNNFELIQGNTDQYLGENNIQIGENIKKANIIMGNAYLSDIKEITTDNLDFLKNLPTQKEINIGNIKILLVHGSPRANNENIFPSMPIEEIEKMITNTDADLIFCGHTHQPCGYQTNTKQTIVNVGSVGRPLSEVPKACYALLEITNEETKEFNLSHVLVNYNKELAAEMLTKRNFEGSDKLAKMIICASERYPS